MKECDEKGHIPYSPNTLIKKGVRYTALMLQYGDSKGGESVSVQLCERCRLLYWEGPVHMPAMEGQVIEGLDS